MRIHAAVQCGLDKARCEDTVVIGETVIFDGAVDIAMNDRGAVCIADGVGGNAGGYIASAYVAEHLKYFSKFCACADEKAIRDKVISINGDLLKEGNRVRCPKMATTLTGLICGEDNKYIIHIGNTRAYVLQGRYLKQLTVDHTVYNRLLKMGRIDEASLCKKNEITNCLGGNNVALADSLYVAPVQDFNVILLTSDGIHDFVGLDELECLITSGAHNLEKCQRILQSARSAGSADDLSAVIIMN